MELFDAIYRRRSLRRFVPGAAVSKEKINRILESARQVPGPAPIFTVYPWRYLFLTDTRAREMMGRFGQETARVIFGVGYETWQAHLWYMEEGTKDRVGKESSTGDLWRYPVNASFVVLPCYARAAWGSAQTPLLTIPVPELCSATVGMTAENMWLQATEEGLACAMNAMPVNDPRRREMVADVLGIPHSWEFLGVHSFGVPAAERFVGPSRGPIEGIAYDEVWGNPYVRAALRTNGNGRNGHEEAEEPRMELKEAMAKQRHVKKFAKEEVPGWKIEKVLDAARWAPNPENLQHWRFVVIRRNQKFKERMAQWAKEYANLAYVAVKPQVAEGLRGMIADLLQYAGTADTIIIPCYSATGWIEYPHAPGSTVNYIFAGATGGAIQNLWLAAIGVGLGVTYDILPAVDVRRKEWLCEALGIPRSWEPLGALYLGVPESHIPPLGAPRKEEIVYQEQWGFKYEW